MTKSATLVPKSDDSPSLEMIDSDRAVFTSGNRVYRISNLSNNHLIGKLIILIKAYTTNEKFGHTDRINFFHIRSRNNFAKLAAERWRINQAVAKSDMANLCEMLLELGYGGGSTANRAEFGKRGNPRRA